MEGYRGKRVFVTGNTGFKGVWLSLALLNSGAIVKGYALDPPTEPSLFDLLALKNEYESVFSDIRNLDKLAAEIDSFNPDIVFHLAAQPIVIDGYARPVETYEINVMGTVNIIEAIRKNGQVKSFLNVTTDKVYYNKEWCYGYRENDELNGYDPYSNSKSCSELVTDSYRKSFFNNTGAVISTARAGNVIGGGDFSANRIVPDCCRAVSSNTPLIIRNPDSIRPYQHVLEPVSAYMLIALSQIDNRSIEGSYNIGPEERDCITTQEVVSLYKKFNNKLEYTCKSGNGIHEAELLKLDCSKIRSALNWKAKWNVEKAMQMTVEIYEEIASGLLTKNSLIRQINEYERKKI